MSDAIGKINVQVAASTGAAVNEFDKLKGQLHATLRQLQRLQDVGRSDALTDATRGMVTQARLLPKGYADATREVHKLIAAHRERLRLEDVGAALPRGGAGRAAAPAGGGGGLGTVVKGGLVGLGLMAADLARDALTAPFDFAKQSVGLAAEAEKTKAAFDVMLGSAEKADRVLAGLRKYAADSPLGSGAVLDTARNLAAVGIAGDQLVPTIRMLGDIAGGDAERLKGVAKAYGDVTVKGQLMAQELNQFSNAGVPLLEELAKVSGRPKELMKAIIERGEFGSAEVVKSMKAMTSEGGRFFGMSDKYAQTYAGSVERVKDSWEGLQREFGKAVIEEFGLKGLAGGGAARLDQVRKGVDGLRPALRLAGEGFKGLTNLAAQAGAVLPGLSLGGAGAVVAAVPELARAGAVLRDVFQGLQAVRIDPVKTGLAAYDAVGVATLAVAGLMDEVETGAAAFQKNWIDPVKEFGKELGLVGTLIKAVVNPVGAGIDLALRPEVANVLGRLNQAREAAGLMALAGGRPGLAAVIAPAPSPPPPDLMGGGSWWSLAEKMAMQPVVPPTRQERARSRVDAGRAGVADRLGGVKAFLNPAAGVPGGAAVLDRADVGLAGLPAGATADPFAALTGGLGAVRRAADQTATGLQGLAGGLAGFGVAADQVKVPVGLPGNLAAEGVAIHERYEDPFVKLKKYDAQLQQMEAFQAITGDERARAFLDKKTELLGKPEFVPPPPAMEIGTRDFAGFEVAAVRKAMGADATSNDLPTLMRDNNELQKQTLDAARSLLRVFEAIKGSIAGPPLSLGGGH